MSYLLERKQLVELLKEGRWDDAKNFTVTAMRRAERLSSDYLYAIADQYAVARFSNRMTAPLSEFFSKRFIRHYNLKDIFDGDVSSVNDAFEAECFRIGFEGNPHPRRGINGEDNLIINNHTWDQTQEPINTLLPVFDRIIKKYLAEMRKNGYPKSLIDKEYIYRLFSTATKGDGYAIPHLHSRAGFVMVYYIRVHRGGEATLQFGTHNMIYLKPFYQVVPKEGDIFIFPSLFMHSSTPTKVDKLRVNFGIELEPKNFAMV